MKFQLPFSHVHNPSHLLKAGLPKLLFLLFFFLANVLIGQTITPADNHILYVKKGVTGTGEGNSWANAIPELADALRWARENKDNNLWSGENPLQIWVAGGTYIPLYSAADGAFTTDGGRNNSFVMIKDVQVYGGFAGTESEIEDRDLEIIANSSILSGDRLGNDTDNFGNNEENVFTVVRSAGNVGVGKIDGVSIRGGNAINNSILTVLNTTILPGGSGGVDLVSSSLLINNSKISGNKGFFGGGICGRIESNYVLKNTIIFQNTAELGGGLCNLQSSPTISNVTITENTSISLGGGMYISNSASVIKDVTISDNNAKGAGGVYLVSSTPNFSNVIISNNNSTDIGGGIFSNNSSPKLINVLLNGNISSSEGGAIYSNSSSMDLRNVTIADNSAVFGGAIYNTNSSLLNLTSTLIFGNNKNNPTGTFAGIVGGASTSNFSLIQNVINTTNNNINPEGLTFSDIFEDFENGDYRLKASSPALNAGDSGTDLSFFPGGPTSPIDLDGNPRVLGGRIDIGAFELFNFVPNGNNVLFVKKGGAGSKAGDSWANAIPELADALRWARENKDNNLWTAENPLQIWVAGGTYLPLYSAADGAFTEDRGRENSFVMVKDVQVFGGFAGNESSLDTRDLLNQGNRSFLQGYLGSSTDIQNAKNHVVISSGDVGVATLDGFQITGSFGSGDSEIMVNANSIVKNSGGGIYCASSSPTMSNLLIFGHAVTGDGGGLFLSFSDPILKNLEISNCSAKIGGGAYIISSSPQLFNLVISKNNASVIGGGIAINSARPQLTNVTITGNISPIGGGIGNENSEIVDLRNTIVFGNSTPYSFAAGGILIQQNSIVDGREGDLNGNISSLNLTVSDIFVDWENGDYRLKAGSPAVNSGNPVTDLSGFPTGPDGPIDLDGKPRVIEGRIDMGAFERQQVPQTITVNSPSLTYGDSDVQFDVSTTSGQGVTYSVAANEFVSVTLDGSGLNALKATDTPIEITISVPENENYDPASITVSVPVNKLQLVLGGPILSPKEFDATTTAFLELGPFLNLVDGDDVIVDFEANYDNPNVGNGKTIRVSYTISGTDADNYIAPIDFISNLGVITSGEIEGITFTDQSFVFDRTAKSLAISGTLPQGTSVSYSNNSRTNVGTQEVTATITGSNFTTLELKANLIIDPANVEGITFANGSFVFDGTAKSLAIVGTLPAGTSVSYSNNSRTNVGTQEVTATITGSNFTTLELKANLIIDPANVEGITFANESFVFDGTAKSLAIVGTLPAGTSVSYINNSRTSVGTQEVTATISGSNFTTLELKANLTIDPANIEGITFVNGSFVFDGAAKSLAISGTLPEGTSVAYENNSRTNVGTQEVTATISGANFTTLELKANLTITPATITGISFANGTFFYDGSEKSLAITGTLPAGTSVAYANNSRTNVGTQEVTATISGSNFTTLELKADLTITPATITGISFANGTFVFDGTEKNLAIAGTLPAGTEVAYTNNGRTNVGTQVVTATITGSNYITLNLEADLNITPKELEVTVNPNQSKIYGDADPVFTFLAAGFAGTDTESIFTGALVREAGENVGLYEISLGNFSAGANYSIAFTAGSFAITPRTLEIIANPNQSKDFGDLDPVLTFTASNFGNEDNESILTGNLRRASGQAVGFYPINLGTLSAGPNYTINFTGADFEIIRVDRDGDGVPDDIEQMEGTNPNDPFDFKDSDGDGIPDYIETQEGTDPNDPSDIRDSDRDGVPDFIEELDSTDPNDPNDFKDSNGDGIPDYRAERAIVSFIDQSLEVAWGTPAAALPLPAQVVAVTGTGALLNLDVVWTTTNYNPILTSTYLIFGATPNLPNGLNNDFEQVPMISVRVLPKPAPQDVTLSNNQFEGSATEFFIEIGAFTVIDPSDDQHEISLVPGAVDNAFFEVIDGILFWSSAEEQAGQTAFTVRIEVRDRAGNVITKDFSITRTRTSLSEIEVPNTFTPNGDRINDTWGVPALRYFRGARVQVFDRGGQRLFYSEDVDQKWDGTFEGKDMPVGTYFWVIEVRETGELRRGILNLLRQ